MQQHRDAWRNYAYGKTPDRPEHFLDGDGPDAGPTEIERLLAMMERARKLLEKDE